MNYCLFLQDQTNENILFIKNHLSILNGRKHLKKVTPYATNFFLLINDKRLPFKELLKK